MSRTRRTYSQPQRDPEVARAAKLAAEAYMASLPPENPRVQALRRLQMDEGFVADRRRIKEREEREQEGQMAG